MVTTNQIGDAIHMMLDYKSRSRSRLRGGLCLAYTPAQGEQPARLTVSRRGMYPRLTEIHAVAAILQASLPGRPGLRPKLEEANGYGCAVFTWVIRQIEL